MKQKKYKKEYKILFDIDSSSIAGGLVQYRYSNDNKLVSTIELFSIRENITNGTEYNFEEYFKRTLKTLHSVAEKVYLESLVTIKDIVINLSAPWSSSQKHLIRHEAKKVFTVTKDLLNKMITHDVNQTFGKNRDYADHNVVLINRHTVDQYGNGYPARTLVGKEVKDIELHSLTTIMSKDTQKLFTETIERVFHRAPRYVSNIIVELQEFRKHLSNINDAIVLQVSGEVTEVYVIQNDHLRNIGSLPCGTYGIIRSIRDELNIPIEKAQGIIQLHHNQDLDKDANADIKTALSNGFRHWFKKFYGLMDEYARDGLLPHTLLVHTHNNDRNWFEEMLMSEDTLREHIHAQGKIELVRFPFDVTKNQFENTHFGVLAKYCEQDL